MSFLRKISITSAVIASCHMLALALLPAGNARFIISNLIQFLASAIAAYACFRVAIVCQKSLRQFWASLGFSFSIWATVQILWIILEDGLGKQILIPSPLHLLYFFAFAPAAVALLQREHEATGFDWLQAFDFIQVTLVLVATYYYVFFSPALWPVGHNPGKTYVVAIDIRNLALVAGFFIRAGVARRWSVRCSYLQVSAAFLLYTIANGFAGYEIVWRHVSGSGTFLDLAWSAPYLLMAVIAARAMNLVADEELTWQLANSSILRSLAVNLFPLAIPFLVLFISSRIAAADLKVAAGAVAASFACYGIRTVIILGQQATIETRFRLLFAKHPQAMFVFDLDTLNFLEVNQAAVDQYGFSRREFLRLKITDIRPPEDIPELMSNLSTIGSVLQFAHVRHKLKSGKIIHVDVTAERLEFVGHRAVLAVAQDVSRSLALEQQLRQSQKMEAVGTLAGGVAHDFNNLLTVIKGYSNMLVESLSNDPQSVRHVMEIERASDRASSLTRQLLAFSRRQIFHLEVLDLNDVVNGVSKMLERLIGEHIFIVRRLAPDLGKLKADPHQLEQVLMNLAVNARDAMPDGGCLTFETANADFTGPTNPGPIEIKAGSYIMLRASDTGCGMSEDVRAHIFEPFYTTKDPSKGTGLGLSTVYGIVKQSDGYIFVETVVGKGTTFTMYFPRIDQPVSISKPSETGSNSRVQSSQTILLVEDEQSVRRLARVVLKSHGFQVLEAESSEDATTICREHCGDIHLLLTDCVMPGMNGRELAAHLKTIRPTMKVVYVSGYSGDSLFRGLADESDIHFLEKPFTPQSLVQIVIRVLEEEPIENGSIALLR